MRVLGEERMRNNALEDDKGGTSGTEVMAEWGRGSLTILWSRKMKSYEEEASP